MPEGDTIWRAASRLRPVLAGTTLERFEAPRLVGDRPRPGTVIDDVEAVGKHLLVHFAGGLSLDTHMRMTGSWHLYRRGERWRKPAHLLRCRLVVPRWEAVCFAAPVVRTYRRDGRAGPLGGAEDPVAHLGPDLCRPDADLDEVVARMERHPEPGTTIAEVLLDQTVAAGIGNVYKSEVLHACGLDPFTPLAAVPAALRRRLAEVASRLLRRNLATARRTTVAGPPGSVAVYGRARRPCPRCGTPIRVARHGAQARSTYWCPRCQRPPRAAAGPGNETPGP
ncbi:MAG TPA: DNA-formamidopyrimidine glycosylase family protein [Acidimicrobiales bacterium]|nr:DNA-formamidopyrimidine glycosylase family protein [Acidimicrobiales bacterium]